MRHHYHSHPHDPDNPYDAELIEERYEEDFLDYAQEEFAQEIVEVLDPDAKRWGDDWKDAVFTKEDMQAYLKSEKGQERLAVFAYNRWLTEDEVDEE